MRVKGLIYLDYQSSTPVDPLVRDAMLPYFTDSFGNPHAASHRLGWESAEAVRQSKDSLAALIGALPEEILFTSGATEANNHAIFGVVTGNQTERKTIIVSAMEHKCVHEAAHFYGSQFACEVKVVPVLSSGQIDLAAYKSMLNKNVLLVSIMAVNNEVGTIQDIRKLAALAHDVGALFHCDAAQAPEAIEIDVAGLDVDLLSLSAHKIYGPKGIGALFIEQSLHSNMPALIRGGGQQEGLRSGTLPVQLCVGFGVAASITKNKGREYRARTRALSGRFIESLERKGANFIVNGPLDNRHPGNLNIRFPGINGDSLLAMLQKGICASTGSACNSGLIESSYVLRAMGLTPQEASESVRISIGRFSDEEQIDDAATMIANSVGRLLSG